MNKIISWVLGLAIGGAVGALLVMLLVPLSGEEITNRLRTGFNETMHEARLASAARRAELEAQLGDMQNKRQLPERSASE